MANPEDHERRGWAARRLAAEDARWAIQIALSAEGLDGWAGYVGLPLSHHFVRIAYEGALLIRSTDPTVGWPELAPLLEDQFAQVTARARHATKFLDDTKRTDEEILEELSANLQISQKEFISKAFWPLRRFARDLGLYVLDEKLLGASVPTAYRLALDPGSPRLMAGADLSAVTREWGSTMAVLRSADLQEPVEHVQKSLPPCPVVGEDVRSQEYLLSRYDPAFLPAEKLLLLLIEGDLNVNVHLLPMVSAGHQMATFRVRVITLYHSLTALGRVLDRHQSLDSGHARQARLLLKDDRTQRLLTNEGRRVRNRCMHYEMKGPLIRIDENLPMFGIVEALVRGQSWAAFDSDVVSLSSDLAELLTGWSN